MLVHDRGQGIWQNTVSILENIHADHASKGLTTQLKIES